MPSKIITYRHWVNRLLCSCLLLLGLVVPELAFAASPFSGVINLNTATQAELEELPGVGPSKAGRILEHRRQRPFRTVAELVRVKGFGVKTLQRLRPHLTITAPTQLASAQASSSCVCPRESDVSPSAKTSAPGKSNQAAEATKIVSETPAHSPPALSKAIESAKPK